jgi:starch synthase
VEDYRHAVRRAFALYHRRSDWSDVRQTGMRIAFDWATAAQRYTTLYESLIQST